MCKCNIRSCTCMNTFALNQACSLQAYTSVYWYVTLTPGHLFCRIWKCQCTLHNDFQSDLLTQLFTMETILSSVMRQFMMVPSVEHKPEEWRFFIDVLEISLRQYCCITRMNYRQFLLNLLFTWKNLTSTSSFFPTLLTNRTISVAFVRIFLCERDRKIYDNTPTRLLLSTNQ